ncbi:hypothetical protein BHE74_00021922 [Ensete ventricosum]|nr:hypothetical protein BHE74_00021922 [Ensete ventricosum]
MPAQAVWLPLCGLPPACTSRCAGGWPVLVVVRAATRGLAALHERLQPALFLQLGCFCGQVALSQLLRVNLLSAISHRNPSFSQSVWQQQLSLLFTSTLFTSKIRYKAPFS